MESMTTALDTLGEVIFRVKTAIRKVIIGQEEALDAVLIAILTRQHALIEGVPGVAKTLLTRTVAHVLGCPWGRIQFTPDLMPADITGTNVFNLQRSEFMLVRGPIFTTFLLADEINRAPAKTQSALLQAMQERTVSIDRETFSLPPDFTVFATQNPLEFEGTYPLPEAQKDRFMLKINMGWPSREEETALAGPHPGRKLPGGEPGKRRSGAGSGGRTRWAASVRRKRCGAKRTGAIRCRHCTRNAHPSEYPARRRTAWNAIFTAGKPGASGPGRT